MPPSGRPRRQGTGAERDPGEPLDVLRQSVAVLHAARQAVLHYRRNRGLTVSFAGFGRRARRSACHCAVEARYSRRPLRVAALRRSSLEIVDGERPS